MCQVLASAELSQGTEPNQIYILGSFYFGGGTRTHAVQTHNIILYENNSYYFTNCEIVLL